ncbi:MAG TPA: hypothetical protein VN761_11250 [Candidatus Polarisedimenticolia bacterium]|nr:hypothetical protein [Candidatus Polarisedimenticolia bacterium]
MKKLNFRNGVLLVSLAALFQTLTALAQLPGAGMNSAMVRLFGDNISFTTRADVQVFNDKNQVWLQMPSVMASTDGKMRIDVDLGLLHSSALPANIVAYYKKLGMDRVISVTRPDKKALFIIYPRAQSYAVMPLANEDTQAGAEKLERKPLGKETIDGHPCVKNLSTVKTLKGTPLMQAVTWNATDLKEFPLRIETKENGNTTVMRFQQVNLNKPDPRLFDAPASYKQFMNPADLEAAAAKKAGATTSGGANAKARSGAKPGSTKK